jgi:cyclophilin family peptidyl-prolyl cis-trans isomerase
MLAVMLNVAQPDFAVGPNVTTRTIDLNGRFDDEAVTGTVVQFTTDFAAPNDRFHVELFDAAGPGRNRTTPATAANFLQYADANLYDNTIIHRVDPAFVVQGGGFSAPTAASGQPGGAPTPVSRFAAVTNEPGNSNVRGTIAMAKEAGNANSATNQWFFNLENTNASNLDAQNGGFTAFGRVLGQGMSIVDIYRTAPVYKASAFYGDPSGTFEELPLRNMPNPLPDPIVIQPSQFLAIKDVSRVGELVYSVGSSDPSIATVAVNQSGQLTLTFPPGAWGAVTIIVRAESVFEGGDFSEDTFTIYRQPRPGTAVAARAGNEVWLSTAAGGQFTTAKLATLPDANVVAMLTGDFTGDGREDVATYHANGLVQITPTLAGGGTSAPVAWAYLPPSIAWQSFVSGDFNGDRVADIAARNPTTGDWRVLTGTGTGFGQSSFWNWSRTANWVDIVTGDFNRDGRTDIAGRNRANGQWLVSSLVGIDRVTKGWGVWPTNVIWANVVSGDFNGDGRTDIAGRDPGTGTWRIAVSNGTVFTAATWWTWATTVAWKDVVAADFDGDGRTDIAGRRPANGAWTVSRFKATPVTGAFGSWDAAVAWTSVMAGDFNGDGRADIAGRDPVTGKWRIASGGLSAFTMRDGWTWSPTLTWTTPRVLRT